MSDVFISYKQEERDRMRPIAAGLRAYTVRISDSQLALVGPDGAAQPEAIRGVEQGWLQTQSAGDVASFYQRRGRVLAYRYADVNDEAGESRFERCE